MSTDQGHTFSTPEVISGVSPLCFFGNALDPSQPPNACNFDLGPDPTVLPNGDVVVVFNNFNTPEGNPNAQQLAVRCKPTGSSSSGTAKLNCAAPTKVGDDVVVGEPSCDFTFECIPGAYIRTNDFPRINKNVNGTTLYATWQDYRDQEFDIQLARSTDGGVTWSQIGTVNPDRGRDHYFPAIDVAPRRDRDDESRIGISYFRTDRVPDENTAPNPFGCPPGTQQLAPPPAPVCSGTGPKNSDYVLAGTRAAHVPAEFKVLSPPFAPPDGKQTGFNGDYSGLTITPDGQAHPIWSDTRNTNPYPENGVVHDEDVFTTATGLP
jgi:hypothetical protein